MLALSKTMENSDLAEWPEEVARVKLVGVLDQTPEARIWEYAQALRAFDAWGGKATHEVTDVGGAGSPFWKMLNVDNAFIVDPKEGVDLATWLSKYPRLVDAVFCLSVLEHVEHLDQFLYHLTCLVAPGGLLVLTFDCIGHDSGDHAHFHWDRKRIFGPALRYGMLRLLRELQMEPFGEYSSLYPADTLYGSYAVASLVLRKRA